jgi:hypothetical protein
MTDRGGEFVHQAIGHLARDRQLARLLELLDRDLGIRTDDAGRLQLAIAVFGQCALHRGHAVRSAD